MAPGNVQLQARGGADRPTVAFAIVLTKDGRYLDGAAVLAEAVMGSWRGPNSSSSGAPGGAASQPAVDYELVAIVARNVTASRPVLRFLGYRVLERPLPVAVADIAPGFLRNRIAARGCCGADELLKLWAYSLAKYSRVLLLDMDSLVLRNLDELFFANRPAAAGGGRVRGLAAAALTAAEARTATEEGGPGSRPPGGGVGRGEGPRKDRRHDAPAANVEGAAGVGSGGGGGGEGVELLFTYDYGMDVGGTAAPPAQGGFLALRPSAAAFAALCAVVRGGDFRKGQGWAGSLIGPYWGGMTIQGLVPYYYLRVEPTGRAAREVDRCIYNNMADNARCRATPLADIANVHFTVCHKPWICLAHHEYDLCSRLHDRWFALRARLERRLGLPPPPRGPRFAKLGRGGCTHGGPKGYVPVAIADAMARLGPGHVVFPPTRGARRSSRARGAVAER